MIPTRRTPRLPTYLLGCLTAALLTTHAVAVNPGLTLNYTDGQTDATGYDTTAPNSPTTLSILSGTATQSGVLTGSGSVIKTGAGTLILSGANDYSGSTTVNGGVLEVATNGSINSRNNTNIGSQQDDHATLRISGGSVTDNKSFLGNTANAFGTATVSGGSWNTSTESQIGANGTGLVNLSGGSISNGSASLGHGSGSSGTVNVSDGIWSTSGEFYVGNSGNGVLNVTGGSVSSGFTPLGYNSSSSGTVNVSGGSWTIDAQLAVGWGGSGILNITGGSVESTYSYLATNDPVSRGTANVSGGTWTTTSDFFLGYSGTAVLNLTDSGTVSVGSGNLIMALGPTSNATLNLGTGGVAGTLVANTIYGGIGTTVVNFNHTGDYNFSPVLSGRMTVNNIGSGSTFLTKANTYTGPTNVLGGRLVLSFVLTLQTSCPPPRISPSAARHSICIRMAARRCTPSAPSLTVQAGLFWKAAFKRWISAHSAPWAAVPP